jgi:curved DNA-binding protein CbpA
MNEPRKVVKENTLATVPPPKRALDTLHESYRILKIDDTKPLTHESLRLAYKKAAAKAHPDRGGSAEEFDEVTRAFLYLEEVIHKLIPKGATDGDDPRFKQAVTKEAAIKAREGPLTKYDAEEAAHRMREHASTASAASREEPKIALNPKNLNMSVFNKLFEENRLPDPDQDGYGDWLKSSGEDRRLQNESQLRSKFNADIFNKTFAEQGITRGDVAGLTKYQAPDAITHHGGTELGAGRPSHYISPLGAKTGYTDLKFAYGEGSTFSQDVVGIKEEKRTLDAMKRERESAPTPLTAEEQRMLDSIDRQKAAAEEERRRRLAVHDVAAEDVYAKMQRRLMIN